MRDEALHLLRCPVCRSGFIQGGRSLRCRQGHSFDVARQGYVDLLPGRGRRGTADTAQMVAAREAFLAAGRFDGLREAVAEAAARALRPADGAGTAATGCVVDAGAGTGFYLAGVLDRLPGRVGLALDLSRFAMRRAARVHARVAAAVVCDIWSALPVADRCADLVLSVFAPRNPSEFRRVLRPDGRLLVVSPSGRHLRELVSALGLLTVDEHKEGRLERALSGDFTLVGATLREEDVSLDAQQVVTLVGMGPSARHVDSEEIRLRLEHGAIGREEAASASGSERFQVTLSVILREYAPRPV